MFQYISRFVLLEILFLVSDVLSKELNSTCDCEITTYTRRNLPVYVRVCSGLSIVQFPTVCDDSNILDLSDNNIQTLDSKQVKLKSHSLQILILSSNEISHISKDFLAGVTSLTELDLSNNLLKILDSKTFENLNMLSKLDLSYNSFTILPTGIFNGLHKLESLDLSYNFLGKFLTSSKTILTDVLQINKNINQLTLNGLNLSNVDSINFESFKKLKTLSIADNAFAYIPTIPSSVEFLDMSGNNLTFVSVKYLNYHSLKELRLNRMPSLTDIHHYAFYNLYSLENLQINHCPNLKEFNELAFDLASKNFHLHPKQMSLASNGLKSLNESYKYFFQNMNHIDLRHNPWMCDCNIIWLKEFNSKLYKSHELR